MQLNVDIKFDDLVKIARRLPLSKWKKLKQEVESQQPIEQDRHEFRKFLIDGPTFSQEQLNIVAETRKNIDEWRKI